MFKLVIVFKFFSFCSLLLFSISVSSNEILKDGNLTITKEEVENALLYWPEQSRQEGSKNVNVQLGLLSDFVLNKKVATLMDEVTEKSDPTLYWQQQFAIRNLQNKLYFKNYKEKLEIPNFNELAKETFLVNKDKYALIPEKRKASHILIKCLPGKCDRKEKRPIAETVLSKLNEGVSFEVLVEEYSGDPGSKARKGKLKNWISRGEPKMNAYFVEGLYSIEGVGNISDIVETKFGFHIIRVDEIQEKSYKKEEEVFPKIIEELEKKYRNMSLAVHMKELTLSDDAEVELEIVDELFKAYSKDSN